MAADDAARFHWADYVVFSVTVAGSSAIGLYHGMRRRNASIDEYLLAGRDMPVLPVSLSLYVTWLSAISFLGDPVEVYFYGLIYWLMGVGFALALPVVAAVFVPRFHSMQLTSLYEYLQERFDRRLRPIASIAGGCFLLVYLSIALYAPSLALSQVTGLDVHYTIFLIGCVSTFYTTLGGMKAVLWADAVQSLVMVTGIMSVIVVGISKVGGLGEVWRIADEGGRINFWNFDPSPLARSTVWTYVIGGFFRVFNPYISMQPIVQRYGTVATAKQAQLAVYLNIPMYLGMTSLFALAGLVLFAKYGKCDPFLAGTITKRDQMMPLLVIETLGDLPGFPGLFLACIVCASLSTTSSGQNSLAATLLADIIRPIFHRCTGRDLSSRRSIRIAELTATFIGGILIVMAYVITEWKSTIFHLTIQVTGMMMGPMAGLFILGILFPFVNTKSALGGFSVAMVVNAWLGVGSMLQTTRTSSTLPITTEGCLMNSTVNYTANITASISTPEHNDSFKVADLYGISPMMFSALGTSLTVIVGAIAGYISNCIRRRCVRHTSKQDDVTKSPEEVAMRPISTDTQQYREDID